MIYNDTLNAIPLNDYKNVCNSCTLYIVLFVIILIISISINSAFIYWTHGFSRKGPINSASSVGPSVRSSVCP